MMDKEDKRIILGLIFAILVIILSIVGSEKVVVGETHCVDGLNRVNLEGIMCEDLEDRWFGVHPAWSFLMIIPIILNILYIIKGGKN